MHIERLFVATVLATSVALGSPIHGQAIDERNLSPAVCSEVVIIIDVLKLYKATPFCSTFLDIKTSTVTSVTTQTSSLTVTTGSTAKSTVFSPGAAPTPAKREAGPILHRDRILNRDAKPDIPALEAREHEALPSYISAFATSAISAACSCLSLPTPSATITATTTITDTITVTPPAVTTTIYPCPPTLPSPGPTYGEAPEPFPPSIISTGGGNTLYPLDSTFGASALSCCNACFFDLTYCIQAYWYFYEGCVIDQAVTVTGTEVGVSQQCPQGTLAGLVYSPDTNPPFRSTGSIAGPCGVAYPGF